MTAETITEVATEAASETTTDITDYYVYIVAVLMVVLIASQIILGIKQMKDGAADGKKIMIIAILVFIIWAPLTVFKFLLGITAINIAWYAVAGIYMIFTCVYTNKMINRMGQSRR